MALVCCLFLRLIPGWLHLYLGKGHSMLGWNGDFSRLAALALLAVWLKYHQNIAVCFGAGTGLDKSHRILNADFTSKINTKDSLCLQSISTECQRSFRSNLSIVLIQVLALFSPQNRSFYVDFSLICDSNNVFTKWLTREAPLAQSVEHMPNTQGDPGWNLAWVIFPKSFPSLSHPVDLLSTIKAPPPKKKKG